MPVWMAALHRKFLDVRTHGNIRIFLARLISNRSKVFQPYAKFWVTPLVQMIVGGECGGAGFHYFMVDLLVTILSWSTTAILEVSILPLDISGYCRICDNTLGFSIGQSTALVLDGELSP